MKQTFEQKAKHADFIESLNGKSKEDLEKIEADLIKQADDVDKELADMKFDLPDEDREKIYGYIREFIDKQSYSWEYTLGASAMYSVWDVKNKSVSYAALDSTLRTLGQLTFTGHDEWNKVIAINKYFEPIHEQYANATNKIYDVAEKHSIVMDKLQLFEPVNNPNADK